MLILISSSTLKSQIKTTTEEEQLYDAEMKVNPRDISVDKKKQKQKKQPPRSVGLTTFRATQT